MIARTPALIKNILALFFCRFKTGIFMLGRFVTYSLDDRFTQFDYDQVSRISDF